MWAYGNFWELILCWFLGKQHQLIFLKRVENREILPFMVLAIGVENIFVLTNSIVSTSMDLPVKKRVGIGKIIYFIFIYFLF